MFTLLEELLKLAMVCWFLGMPIGLLLIHRRLSRLERGQTPVATPVAPPTPALPRPQVPTPPPMPVVTASPAAPTATTPDPLIHGLRRLGLFPPEELKGEGALGAWITVRIGAALGIAAVVFLGVWLNLRSTLPAWVRLAEVITLGGALAGLGLRLRTSRPDLGTVITSLGLGVLQFAAWASSGLDRMQVIDSPIVGGIVQLGTAAAIGLLALRLGSSQLAQLSAFALTLSGLLVARHEDAAITQASHLVALAVLGALALGRRQWTAVAAVALGGATWLGLRLPADEPFVASAAALLTLLSFWLATQSVTHRKAWSSGRARTALTFAAVALPSLLLVDSQPWTDGAPRAWAALAAAVLCAAAGLRERQLGGRAEPLLAIAVVFAGAAGAWTLEAGLDWLPWALAAATAHALARASDSSLMEWTCDGLTVLATLFAARNNGDPGLAEILLAVGALSLLLGFRGSRLMSVGAWRAILPTLLLGIFLAYRFAGTEIERDLKGLIWLLPVLAALVTRSALPVLAAIVPLLMTQLFVLRALTIGGEDRHQAGLAWSLALLAFQLGATVLLSRRASTIPSRLMAGLAGLSLLPLVFHLVWLVLPGHRDLQVGGWLLAAGIAFGALRLLHDRGANRAEGSCLLLVIALSGIAAAGERMLTPLLLTPHYLVGLALWVAGIAAFLFLLARETRVSRIHPAIVSATAATFLLVGMAGTGRLLGSYATVVWLVTAGLAFAIGHRGDSRPIRLVALAFLGLATLKLIVLDVTELGGRILVCAVAAAAFLGVAWAYGRRSRPEGDKAGID